MERLFENIYKLKIWVRLVVAIWLMIAVAWTGMLGWAFRVQRDTAIDQARDFAESVHQMTLAGLTGMMITGTAGQRAVFLDQIKQSNNIRTLRVVRGEAVTRQFGKGAAEEIASDPAEYEVLRSGRPVFQIRREGGREILKAVMPAIARRDYLGKDCLGCHRVAEGAVLGAVAMEISLDRMNAAVTGLSRDVFWTAVLISVPLMLLIYFSLSRSVTRPLKVMTDGLNQIAEGEIDLSRRLPVRGSDEIAGAAAAFNRVMEKTRRMVEAERISADVFEHALEGIMVCDRSARILKVNPAFTLTTGYAEEEAVGQTPRLLQSGRHDEAFYQSFWEALTTRGQWRGDIWNKRKNGEVYPEWLNISSVRDERGEIEYYIAVFSDITERKRQEAIITYQAYHDALTGLPNRVLFKDRLDQALAVARRRGDQPVAVMFLDLDRFKFINDSLGHDVGDQLLKEVARRLRASVRETDTVARLGGDEFTVLLPEISDPKSAELVASKILAATRQPYHIRDKELFVTTSIGISLYPGDGRGGEDLMKNADAAMYHVKGQGRAGHCFYAPELGTHTLRHVQLEGELHRAIERNEFSVLYQPQLSLETGKMIGVEALVRWNHPRLGQIPPAEFLHLAEETGLIVPIGEWVLATACSQASSWRAQGFEPLLVSVNLSPRQFYHDNLMEMIGKALGSSGLPAQCLELEISEALAMQEVERTIGILEAIARLGVRLAITEFGVGFYSSVNELRRMPINTIKIDRSFVRDLNTDAQNCTLVEGMINLSRGPELKVVAMGVENSGQLDRLRAMRCDHAQGHLFSEPLPAERIPGLLSRAPVPRS
ncbi:MAG: EAL domain-containing protein [Betaproteobacteria bacterium]|nr:EAL domain-containing protein [Betaproteobacteria bacterium]